MWWKKGIHFSCTRSGQCCRTIGIYLLGAVLIFATTTAWAAPCPEEMVRVDSFCMDKHEATNAEYQEVTAQGPYKGAPGYARPQQPRVGLSWDDARGYCEKLGKHLPTEAEWWKAANVSLPNLLNNNSDVLCKQFSKTEVVFARDRPADVCSKKPNAFGLCDMFGNAWEWANEKVRLGGGCQNCIADDIFDIRSQITSKSANALTGVRCAKDLSAGAHTGHKSSH